MFRRFLVAGVAAGVAVVALAFGVTAANAAAVANAGGPYTGAVGVPVQFSAVNTTGAVSYLWSFGDGTASSDIAPLHTYSAAATYTVTLTATVEFGQSSVAATTATIIDSTTALSASSIFAAPQCAYGGVLFNGGFYCVGTAIAPISPLLTTWP